MTDELSPKNATILVVDDNEANRVLARETLEDEGYRVTLANDGPQGIASFEREPPDCVLLDVRMPGMDGFTVCEKLRAMPRGADTPILFLTAQRDIETFDRARVAGADDFLTKPVRPSELVVRVQTALNMRRLRAELREHYDLLKRQRDDILRVSLQKERLTAFVVHDLKNPVNSMDLNAQLLLRERGLSEAAREYATSIRTEARLLGRMISNLLDLSKADEGKLAPKRASVSLRALIGDVIAELAPRAQEDQVELVSSIEVDLVHGDEDLLRRLLANLVENAIRYTPSRSAVRISVTAGPSCVELRVADAGKGIPPEMREKVFDAFVQVDQERSEQGSVRGSRGLGLTFCKLAVEAHGGRIWIEDRAPGAVFCVRLPGD